MNRPNARSGGEYEKPHGTIEFLIAKENDKSISTLARCHGTALKKRIKDISFHRPAGIVLSKAVCENTEREITAWVYKNYGLTV